MEAFDIASTASFILRNGFERVALQFPDRMLKDSVAVTSSLRKEISKQQQQQGSSGSAVRLFVMADTTYGSCCADEVAAMHVDAQCIVHYGHTCLSVPSRLPVWFVFGRGALSAERCATSIVKFAAGKEQPVLVMCGLSYVHALHEVQGQVSLIQVENLDIAFVSTPSQLMEPHVNDKAHEERGKAGKSTSEEGSIHNFEVNPIRAGGKLDDGVSGLCSENSADTCCRVTEGESTRETAAFSLRHKSTREGFTKFNVGGLTWVIPADRGMEKYILLWIGGDDDPGLTNMALTFNSSTIVRYDCQEDRIVTDVVKQSQFLKRRYYLVERAKEANLVGILVGTLGVDGYGETIERVRRIVEASGKKAYVMVMGKPNPSKLANFPECDVFVLVACPQTALLDSKEFLAPVITPFEAELAFLEGKQWTGEYRLDFGTSSAFDSDSESAPESSIAEPRFSFFTGSYVGKDRSEDTGVKEESSTAIISRTSQHALQLLSESSVSIATVERSVLDLKSGAEYLASRTYQGLDINHEGPEGPSKASLAVIGRKGRASVYSEEVTN